LKDTLRKVLLIAGIVLIGAGLCVVGYYTYSILSTGAAEQEGVNEAEALLENPGAYVDDSADTGYSEEDPAELPGETYDPFNNPDAAAEEAEAALNGVDATAVATAGGSSGTSGPKGTSAPKKSSAMGLLVFESLGGRKVAVYNGVTNSILRRGAGHHPRTSKPGAVGNCVIFGHRDTVFRGFGGLKAGATIRLEVPGETERIVYRYTVISTAVVDPDDPKIFKAYGDKIMTLVTCYPFNYVGAAPQRYIVVAKLQE
jgi:sortase A